MADATASLRRKLWNPEARLAYILIAPTAVFLVAFMFYPIIYVFVMSFFRTNKLSDLVRFVGLWRTSSTASRTRSSGGRPCGP